MDKKMTLITQIRTEDYCYCKEEYEESVPTFVEEAIAEGVVLGHLTNGEVIKRILPEGDHTFVLKEDNQAVVNVYVGGVLIMRVDANWWDANWEATHETNS